MFIFLCGNSHKKMELLHTILQFLIRKCSFQSVHFEFCIPYESIVFIKLLSPFVTHHFFVCNQISTFIDHLDWFSSGPGFFYFYFSEFYWFCCPYFFNFYTSRPFICTAHCLKHSSKIFLAVIFSIYIGSLSDNTKKNLD